MEERTLWEDNEITRQANLADQEFDRKSDQFHRGQKELLPGRNFLFNVMRYHDDGKVSLYKNNFDDTFNGCPGSPEWLDNKFNENGQPRWKGLAI